MPGKGMKTFFLKKKGKGKAKERGDERKLKEVKVKEKTDKRGVGDI